jgi:hypothetical protein
MITDINSEDRLAQETFAAHLCHSFGWNCALACNGKAFRAARDLLFPRLMSEKWRHARECRVVYVDWLTGNLAEIHC